PITVSSRRNAGNTGSTLPSEVASRADAVIPITLSPYNFGAVMTAKPNDNAAARAITTGSGCVVSNTAVRAAPATVPQIRLTVRTNTDAYSGRTITATVNGSQNECAGSCSARVTAVANPMHNARRAALALAAGATTARTAAGNQSCCDARGRCGAGLSASASA